MSVSSLTADRVGHQLEQGQAHRHAATEAGEQDGSPRAICGAASATVTGTDAGRCCRTPHGPVDPARKQAEAGGYRSASIRPLAW